MKISDVTSTTVKRVKRMRKMSAMIETLKRKREELHLVHWSNEVLPPLAKALCPLIGRTDYTIMDPTGIRNQVSVNFFNKPKKTRYVSDVVRLVFVLAGLFDQGSLAIVDFTKYTGQYASDTYGYLNGMNYPTIPIPENTPVEELVKYIR